MRTRRLRFALPAAVLMGLALTSLAVGAGLTSRDHGHGWSTGAKGKGQFGGMGQGQFFATLDGHQETPAVHTNGHGTFSLSMDNSNTLSYTLTYSGLNTPAQVAHVHFGQPSVAGGISFFLCGGPKPACPPGNTSATATVTGTVTAADVMAIPTQGLSANDLGAILQEIQQGFAYANVHTTSSPGGEIRGQISGTRRHGSGSGSGSGSSSGYGGGRG